MNEEVVITNTTSALVLPAATPTEAKKVWADYQALKQAIVTPDDIQVIQGREFFKKSYWRKLATFFNISIDFVEESREDLGENRIYNFICKATAPNGRSAIGTGTCDTMEKGRMNSFHNTRTTAETRATNRAISNLVGGGEVSAEEMTEESSTAPKKVSSGSASPAQIKYIEGLLEKKKQDPTEFQTYLKRYFDKESPADLTIQEAKEIINHLQDIKETE